MKKGLFSFFIILIILSLAACGGSSGDDDKVTLDPILDEAVDLGDFPEDAEVVEMEDLTVNGTDVTGTDSVELDDTTESEIDVSVTLPPSLSRSLNLAGGLNIWTNGRSTKVLYNSETRKADLGLPLEMGPNYFTFHFDTTSGKRYRSVVIKVTRIGVALKFELRYATENFASLSTVQSVKFNVKADGYSKSFTRKTSNRNIDIGVPSLTNAAINITAYTSTDDTSFVLEYSGAKTVASVTGTSVDVPVSMAMSKSKLVVPDSTGKKLRIYRNINDDDPEIVDVSLSAYPYYEPLKIDFDSAGRVYVLYTNDTSIVKIYDTIDSSSKTLIDGSDNFPNCSSMSIYDGFVFLVSQGELYINKISTGEIQEIANVSDGTLLAVEVDGDGNIYLAELVQEGNYYTGVLKFKLTLESNGDFKISNEVMIQYWNYEYGVDIKAHSGSVYVTFPSSQYLRKINKESWTLSKELGFVNDPDFTDHTLQMFIGFGWNELIVLTEKDNSPDNNYYLSDFDYDSLDLLNGPVMKY